MLLEGSPSPPTTVTHPPIDSLCAVEANIEVIDDLEGEAQEIAQSGNTWLTYGPPMQLARVHLPVSNALSLAQTTHMLPPSTEI